SSAEGAVWALARAAARIGASSAARRLTHSVTAGLVVGFPIISPTWWVAQLPRGRHLNRVRVPVLPRALGGALPSADDLGGQLTDGHVGPLRCSPQQAEGLVGGAALLGDQDALGLLDHRHRAEPGKETGVGRHLEQFLAADHRYSRGQGLKALTGHLELALHSLGP